MQNRDIPGAVVLVTGASSGVGWQTAARLSEAGAKLCITARRADALERLAVGLRAKGGECLAVPGDVTIAADVERVVERCVEEYGRIDILVNNAAVQIYAPFEEYEWDEIERVFDVTCFGYLRFARAVLPHFRAAGRGHLINVLSMLSKGAAPLLSSYSAAKHALLGWSDSLRLELRKSGIDVSNVLLPSVATPMFDHAQTKLGRAPRPIPPTYDPDIAARAILRCAKKPNPASVPVFLQGRLILWLQHWVPRFGEWILANWGVPLQQRKELVDPDRGNLFEPMWEGIGPRGSIPATPRWLRWGAVASFLAVAGGAAFGAVRLVKR
jgi:short-subunit dehydrogenase